MDSDGVQRHPAVAALLPALLFAGLVASPLVLAMGGVKDSAKKEYRRSNPFPAISWSAEDLDRFPSGFDAWYQDIFGLRTELITAFNWSSAAGLRESPTDRFVIGKDKWIFHDESGAVDTFRGVLPFSRSELEQWRAALEQRSRWLASQGSTFLYAPIPSKLEVYPEQLPEHIKRIGQSRRAQLLEHLAQHSFVQTLDLLPALIEAKSTDGPGRHVYFPYGVHWTDLGARAAAEAISARLRELDVPAGPSGTLDDYKIVAAKNAIDSLAPRLHLEEYFTERECSLKPRVKEDARRAKWKEKLHREDSYWKGKDKSLPTAAVYHDSFGIWVLSFLAQSFRETHGLRHVYFEPALLADLKPDVVIQLQTERLLVAQVPMLLSGMGDEEFAAAFAASEDVRLEVAMDQPLEFLVPFDDGTVSVGSGPGGPQLEIETLPGAAVLLTPTFDPKTEDRCLVLRLDVETPKSSKPELFFKTEADREYGATRSYPFELRAGRHVYFVPLSYRKMQGELGLRLGVQPGEFILRDLDIRAVDL